jgi:L-threonylcarbamoyladenylate synthase
MDTRLGQVDETPASPGMLPVHYAPRTPAIRVDSAAELLLLAPAGDTAILALGRHCVPKSISSDRSFVLAGPREAAHQLYAALHQLDALGLHRIVVIMPPDQPEWTAIRDRLLKATRPATAG